MNTKAFVLAIAGGTCSGKSTLTEHVEAAISKDYRVKTINMDKYFKVKTPTVIAPITRIEYVEHNHPTTLELDRLKEDFSAALCDEWDLVIIEGLFALYIDEFRDAADLKVFVDLESDARLVRRITKHMAWGKTYEEVTDRYIDTVRFRHNELIEPTRWHADIVINGTLDDNIGLEVLKEYVGQKLSQKN